MVLLRLVFLDNAYLSEVFQTLLAVPHFSKVAAKDLKAETVMRRCSVKKGFQSLFFTALRLQLY